MRTLAASGAVPERQWQKGKYSSGEIEDYDCAGILAAHVPAACGNRTDVPSSPFACSHRPERRLPEPLAGTRYERAACVAAAVEAHSRNYRVRACHRWLIRHYQNSVRRGTKWY